MLAVATGVFGYYTFWVFAVPFLDLSNPLQALFLPREYAIRLPILLLLIAGVGVGSFVGKVLIANKEKENKKKSAKKNC